MRSRRVLQALAMIAATAPVVGCGDDPTTPGGESEVTRIQLAPAAAAATSIGEIVQFAARAFDRNGVEVPAVSLTWASSDTAVLVSEGSGRFRTRGNGSVTVAVRVTGNNRVPEQTAPVVVEQVAARLQISTDSLDLYAIGHTALLEAQLFDALGSQISGPVPLSWQSANPSVATVDAGGTVRATGDGTVLISARAGAFAASVDTRVSATFRIAGCLTSTDRPGSACQSVTLTVGAGR